MTNTNHLEDINGSHTPFGFEGFKEGGHTINEVVAFVDKTVFRDVGGNMLGLVSLYEESDGSMRIATLDGSSYFVDSKSEVTPSDDAPNLSEATVIREETIELADGAKISYTSLPVTKMFGGLIMSGQPVISKVPMDINAWRVPGKLEDTRNIKEELLTLERFSHSYEGRQGDFQYYRSQTVGYNLHRPLKPNGEDSNLGVLTADNCPVSFGNLHYVTKIELPQN